MATIANGGINATNDARAAAANATGTSPQQYTVQKGDTLWGISKKYGTSVAGLTSLNPGINPNVLQVGQKLNYSGTAPAAAPTTTTNPNSATTVSSINVPTSYSTLSTPQELMNYANSQANAKFENEKLGYNQQIEQYNQQMGQLQTDDYIKNRANELAGIKYSDALLQVDASKRNALVNQENQMQGLNTQYNRSLDELRNGSFQQRAAAKNSIYSRGLGDSTVLDQTFGQINQNETQASGRLSEDLSNNVSTLNREIGALMATLDDQRLNLTKNQQTEIMQTIQDMTKSRDDQKAQLQLNVNQQNNLINQARNNITTYADSLYQGQYSNYADLYRQDRDFAEDKRRFDLEYALKKQQGGGSGYGGSGWINYGNPGGGSTPSTKTTTSGGTYDRSLADSVAAAKGQSTPTQRAALQKGPISDSYYKKLTNPVSTLSSPIRSIMTTNLKQKQQEEARNLLQKAIFPWK
jgi:hypothetical protein